MTMRSAHRSARKRLVTWGSVLAWATGGILTALPGAATVNATITVTSSTGVPNRVGDNVTSLAIDGDTATGTYTTPSGNTTSPSYLEFGFASSAVNRIRLFKGPDYGPHNLTIQYTTGTGDLTARTWTTVSGLANGYGGAELLNASAVNANGTVTADAHNSLAGDGWASLTFDAVMATGLRIAFSQVTVACCNHYRVYEFEAVYNDAAAPVVSINSLTQGKDYGATPAAYSLNVSFSVTDTDSPPNTATYECTLDDPADESASWATCSSPYAFTGLDPGTEYTASVRVTDLGSNLGNVDTDSLTIVADSTSPVVSSLTATAGKNAISIAFAASDTDDVTTELVYMCRLDTTPWTTCTTTTTHTFSPVPGGLHTVSLQVSDKYGQTSNTSTSAPVRVKGPRK